MKNQDLNHYLGRWVELRNVAKNDDDETKVEIRVEGTLEVTEDPGIPPRYYVRVADRAGGAEGIGFCKNHVSEIDALSSGVPQIILK